MKGEDRRDCPNRPAFEALEPRLLLNGTIEGQVWEDLNGNGFQDPGEPGLNGWTVELVDVTTGAGLQSMSTADSDRNGDGVIDPVTEAGWYAFEGLTIGEYQVRQMDQAGWTQTSPSIPTGQLALTQVLLDGVDDVDGLDYPTRVINSPDGRHMYVLSWYDQAIAVFSRDGQTGELSFEQSISHEDINMLSYPTGMTMDEAGNHLFFGSTSRIVVFDRDAETGRLTFVDSLAGSDGNDILISPDGANVYVTGYNDRITVYSHDGSGGLTSQQVIARGQEGLADLFNPDYLAMSPDATSVYVLASDQYASYSPTLIVFARDIATGNLTYVQTLAQGVAGVDGLNARDVAISEDGKHVYLSGTDSVALFQRDPATGELTFDYKYEDGEDGIEDMYNAISVEVSPDGQHVFVGTEYNPGRVVSFRRNVTTGALTYVTTYRAASGVKLGAIDDMTSSADSRFLYVVSHNKDSIGVFEHVFNDYHTFLMGGPGGAANASFGNVQTIGEIAGQVFNDANNNGLRDPAETGVDGWQVQLIDTTTGFAVESMIADQSDLDGDGVIDPMTEAGLYSFQNIWPGAYELHLVLPDGVAQTSPAGGAHLSLVSGGADQTDLDLGLFVAVLGEIHGQAFDDLNADGVHDVAELGVDGRTVELFDVVLGRVVATGVSAASDLDGDGVIDPATEAGLYSFAGLAPREYQVRQVLPTGWQASMPVGVPADLTIEQILADGVNGIDNLRRPEELAVSPDGRHVYVASSDGLTVLSRDPVSGEMTEAQVLPHVARFLAVNPNGLYVYARSSSGDYSLLVYRRDVATGELSLLQTLTEGVDGVVGLGTPRDIALSPDGRDVLIASWDDSLAIFTQDPTTGLLSQVQAVFNGAENDDALWGPHGLTVSPDGQYVYVISDAYSYNRPNGILATFSRDPATGIVTYIQKLFGATPNGLYNPSDLAVSGDGRHIYVVATGGNSIALFLRDEITGELSRGQILQDRSDWIDGLETPYAVSVTSDDQHVLVVSYDDGSLAIFDRDAATGELALSQVMDNIWQPNSLAISPDNQHVFVTGYYGLTVFDFPHGQYHQVYLAAGDVISGQDFGSFLSVDVSGQVFHDDNADGVRDVGEEGVGGLLVELIDSETGAILGLTRSGPVDLDGNGSVDPASENGLYVFAGLRPGSYETRLIVHSQVTLTLPADGTHNITLFSGDSGVTDLNFGVVVTDPSSISGQEFEDLDADGQRDAGEPGMDGWVIELTDTDTGGLIATAVTTSMDLNGDGSIDPETEAGLYTFDHLLPGDYEIHEVARQGWTQTAPSQEAAQLTPIQQVPDGTGGLNGAASSALSPDGRQLYVTDNFGDALAIFQRNPYTGQLTFDQELRSAGPDAFNLAANVIVSPDGLFVYLTEVDAFYVFQRDPATGDLTFLQTLRDGENGASLSYPRGQAISPDGAFIYVTDERFRGAVTVFRRDPASGLLSVEQVVEHDTNGLDDFNAPYVIRISPNGAHAFVSARLVDGDEALYVFTRDAVTGRLTHLQTLYASTDAPQMGKPTDLACSVDGRHVYTVSPAEDAVTIFARDELTGELSLVGSVYADAVYAVTISPDGQFVYAAGSGNSLLLYHRDAATGELTLADQADTLVGTWALTLSQDGRFLYTSAWADTSVIDVFEHVHTVGPIEQTLAAGEIVSDADFGNARVSALSGQVFVDVNNDGVLNAGENGANSWVVELIDLYGIVVAAAVTVSEDLDGDGVINPATEAGWFTLNEILSGDYEVRVVLPIAWAQSTPEGNYALSLNGQTVEDLDFGVFMLADISGQVFADRHLDGVHDAGDLGQDGWTVELVDPTTGLVVGATTTASIDLDGNGVIAADTESGLYSFDDLIPGDYEVRHVLPAGWTQVAPIGSHLVSLTIGEDVAGVDFADIAYGDIEGQVFDDINDNGVQDIGDVGVNGWTVELVDVASGTVVDTQVTASIDLDSNGTIDPQTEMGVYSFASVAAGDYRVQPVAAPDWLQSMPHGGTGELVFSQMLRDGVGGADYLDGARVLTVSQDGNHLYVGTRYDDAMTVLQRDSLTGELSVVQVVEGNNYNAVEETVWLAMNSDGGSLLVVGGDYEGLLAVYDRSRDTGYVTRAQAIRSESDFVLDHGIPRAAVDSPDGNYVYVTTSGEANDSLLVFVRSATTGLLSQHQALVDDVDAPGLSGPGAVTVSADGLNIYVACSSPGSLVVFSRDAATGRLTHVQTLYDNQDGVDGLAGVGDLLVSPDGLQVYTAYPGDSAVSVFDRDPVTGLLTYVTSYVDGQGGIDGLAATRALAISPDGRHVLAGGHDDNALVVFERDLDTGLLALQEIHQDGVAGVDGLYGISDVSVSPDGLYVYTAGEYDDAVSVFQRVNTGYPQFVTVAAATVSGVDFGLFERASAAGQVFDDADYDGLQGVAENGLNGWTVKLVDVDTGGIAATAITADVDLDESGSIDPHTESGRYAFAGIKPGNYEARLVMPELWSQTYPAAPGHTFAALSGQTYGDASFGVVSLPSIAGQIFSDSDGDGLHGPAETGVNGWTVELVNTATGDVVATAATADQDVDGNGSIDPVSERGTYRFEDLQPGEYLVRQVRQNGWTQTVPAGVSYTFVVAVAQHETGADFGNRPANGVAGQKWHDVDGDGLRGPTEPGLDGWTIELVDPSTGAVIATTVTASADLNTDGMIDPITEAGLYAFTDLPAEDYQLREMQQDGWVQTYREPFDMKLHIYAGWTNFVVDIFSYEPYWLEGSFLEVDPTPGLWKVNDDVFQALPSGSLHGIDFPAYTPGTDPNRYWFVVEDMRMGSQKQWATADKDFDDITIEVIDDPVARTIQVFGRTGDANRVFGLIGSDGTEYSPQYGKITTPLVYLGATYGPRSLTFSLAVGQSLSGMDFANTDAGVVTGQLFNDVNANLARDAGEVGLNGWTVEAVDPIDGRVIASTVTMDIDLDESGTIDPETESGLYVLDYVRVGTVDIRVVTAEGWTVTAPAGGIHTATLAVSETLSGLDFGVGELGTIFGQIFNDLNSSGVQDAGEFGINGWTIEVVDVATSGVVATAVTMDVDLDGSGSIDPATESGIYVVDALLPGDYEVRQVAQAGWSQTFPVSETYLLTVEASQAYEGLDFGNEPADAEVAGQVFGDLDGDGVRDGVEVGVNGWTVELVNPASGVIATATTASEDLNGDGIIDPATERGRYRFAGLVQDDYKVRQVVPAGWQQTAPIGVEERAFAAEVVGGAMTIHEIDPTDGSTLNSFAAPANPVSVGYQGLA
ncbi:hypothetical protein LCGC14_0335140, partial [marine sediment metagenome]